MAEVIIAQPESSAPAHCTASSTSLSSSLAPPEGRQASALLSMLNVEEISNQYSSTAAWQTFHNLTSTTWLQVSNVLKLVVVGFIWKPHLEVEQFQEYTVEKVM